MGTILSPPPQGVPPTRILTATSPLTIDGGTSANLSADRTLAVSAGALGITPFYFGTGSDGSVVFDGTTTILGMVPSSGVYTGLRSYQFNNVTINSGVSFRPDGYPYFIRGDLAGSGMIDTTPPPALLLGQSGTTSWSVGSRPLPPGAIGGLANLVLGGASTKAIRYASTSIATGGGQGTGVVGGTGGILCGGGGGSGAGTAGGLGGAATLVSSALGDWEIFETATTSVYPGQADGNSRASFTVGTGGGGGGQNGSQGSGGGASGAYHVGYIWRYVGTVIIRSRGGNGGDGVIGGSGFSGGGGGGGGGGIVVLVCGPGAIPTPDVAGGSGGVGSAGAGLSAAGGAGGAGKFLIFQ